MFMHSFTGDKNEQEEKNDTRLRIGENVAGVQEGAEGFRHLSVQHQTAEQHQPA